MKKIKKSFNTIYSSISSITGEPGVPTPTIPYSSKEDALKAYSHFIQTFESKYPKAVKCLKKDKEDLFTFYDFPAT